MTKQEKIKKLTRKYFLLQKTKEIITAILIIIGLVLIVWINGTIYLNLNPQVIRSVWSIGLPLLLAEVFAGVILYMLGKMIYEIILFWIESNWEKAEQKAKKELK